VVFAANRRSLDEIREKCNVWRLRCGAPSFWGLVLRVNTMVFKKHETRYNTLQKAWNTLQQPRRAPREVQRLAPPVRGAELLGTCSTRKDYALQKAWNTLQHSSKSMKHFTTAWTRSARSAASGASGAGRRACCQHQTSKSVGSRGLHFCPSGAPRN